MEVPSIDYVSIVLLLACMGFFTKGARMEGRSPLLWGAMSLGMWIGFTQFCMGGAIGGLLSQALLFVGLTGFGMLGERSVIHRRGPQR